MIPKLTLPPAWVAPGLQLQRDELNPPANQSARFQILLLEQISKRYGVSVSEMLSKNRPQVLVHARQLFCFIMKKYYDKEVTLTDLAVLFRQNHTTVMAAKQVYEDALKVNDKLPARVIERIQGKKFETVNEDFSHFQSILNQCLHQPTILSVSLAESDQERTLLLS